MSRFERKVARAQAREHGPNRVAPTLPHMADLHDVVSARRKFAQNDLTIQTEALLQDGAAPVEVLWMLAPDFHGATLAHEAVATIRELHGVTSGLAERIKVFQSMLPPGCLACVYLGPEGFLLETIGIDLTIIDPHNCGNA